MFLISFSKYFGIKIVNVVKKNESIGELKIKAVFENIIKEQTATRPSDKTPKKRFVFINLIAAIARHTMKLIIKVNPKIPKYNKTCKYALCTLS